MSENFVLSISRQYGCGGRELAGILAKKLGVKLYDRQIVHIAAAKLGINDLSEEELLEMEKEVKPLSMSFIPFHSFGTHMGESSRGMFMSESAAIRKLVADGSCVILGRCADYVLRDEPGVLRVFVHAPLEARIKTLMERHNIGEEAARREIAAVDKRRANYYRTFTGSDWRDAGHYDLSLNSAELGLDRCVELVADYLPLRFGK